MIDDPKITTWTSGGTPHEVVTRQGEMTDTEFCRVHDEAVDFWQLIYPPD